MSEGNVNTLAMTIACSPSPSERPAQRPDLNRQLVGSEICRSELAPPVSANTVGRSAAECACELILTRVDDADGYRATSDADGERQIRVIGDDDRRIDDAVEDVHEQMRRDVHVRALLLTIAYRREHHWGATGILDDLQRQGAVVAKRRRRPE